MGNESAEILKKEAIELVEHYFDGATSLSEEARLRMLLADPRLDGPELDEARAVMGYALTSSSFAVRRKISWAAVSGIAAAIAVGATIVFGLVGKDPYPEMRPQCVAYVGGREVNDRDAVMAMVNEDLSDFSEALADANEQIATELAEFAVLSTETEKSL